MSNSHLNEPIRDASVLPVYKQLALGAQHLFTMFGSTILVPLLTGLDVSVALLMGGVCTLIFHLLTKGRAPVYLGSSFAFITPMLTAAALFGGGIEGMRYACGGIVVAGGVYMVISIIVYFVGVKRIRRLFPPVITGTMIMVIGLMLAPNAIGMASKNWGIAFVGFAVVVVVSVCARGFLQIVPVLIALLVGYLVAAITGNVDFTGVGEAVWFGIPNFSLPKFSAKAIFAVAPVALATIVELIGDVSAIGETVEKDLLKDPGLHRAMFADGLASSISGLFGGPAQTTYSENTGVLALTRVWDPMVMRIAAVFAILLGFIPKVSAIMQTIPDALIGGIEKSTIFRTIS